jgi:MFS family permease
MAAKLQVEQHSAEPAAEATGTFFSQAVGRLTNGFRALRVRNYRLFWLGQIISLSGSWMQTTAQAWLVLELTRSPFALGLVTTLQFLPIMLLSLFGGVLIDRFPKHRVVLVTQVLAMFQAAIFGLLVGTGLIQLWQVYLLAAVQGTINAIDNPARQAFVPELSGREHLVNAIALNSMLFNSARIIGPALAGLLIAQFGIASALYLNAASFIAVIVGLLMMDKTRFFLAQRRSTLPVRQQLAEGIGYVWHTASVLQIMLVVAAIGTFGYNFSVVLPLLAGFVLHTDATGFGSLSAFLGIGSLLAAITTAYTRQVTMRRLLIGSGMFSVLLALVAFSTNFVLSAALLVALGFAGITFATTANTLLQLRVPDELRGRVMSIYILLFAGSTPIGGFLIGSLSDIIGVSWTLLVCAGLCLAGVIGATLYRWRTR